MERKYLHTLRRNAALIGGWLFGLYALVSQLINRIALPDVPLADPPGGMLLQVLIYMGIGALLGVISTLLESPLFGAALAGFFGAASIMLFNMVGALDSQNWLGGMAMVTMIAVLPMTLLLTPVSWGVRFAADALTPHASSGKVHPRWKRALVVSVAFILVGITALYPTYVREALQRTNNMVQNAISDGQISPTMQKVWGFPEAAQGSYQIEWSDDWQGYTGTYSASLDQLSAFLMRVKFDNGFIISCLASATTQPVCLNENAPFGQ